MSTVASVATYLYESEYGINLSTKKWVRVSSQPLAETSPGFRRQGA